MLAARKPEVDRARVIHTGWRRCFAAQEAEHMSAPNFDVMTQRFFLRTRRRPHMSSSLCLSLSAYADCPVEMGAVQGRSDRVRRVYALRQGLRDRNHCTIWVDFRLMGRHSEQV